MVNKGGGMISIPTFGAWNCRSESIIFLAVEIVNISTPLNSTLSLTRFFFLFINLATLWNQKTQTFLTYLLHQKSSHAKPFFQSASLKLLEIPWKPCCVVSRILEKPPLAETIVSNFVNLWQWIHVQILFSMFLKFLFSGSSGLLLYTKKN